MTEQEAINDLKMSLRMWGRKPQKESYEMAIQALEKQIPEKGVMMAIKGYTYEEAHQLCCPKCHNAIRSIFTLARFKAKYCPCCGQALDWSSENENTAEN